VSCGGERGSAEYLLDRGADLNWIGFDKLTPARCRSSERCGRTRELGRHARIAARRAGEWG